MIVTDIDFKFIRYMNVGSRRFSFWVTFRDLRSSRRQSGQKAKKELIRFWSEILGTLGDRWEYSSYSDNSFIIKLNSAQDVTMMLLKYHR
jgi:hypothetical protein